MSTPGPWSQPDPPPPPRRPAPRRWGGVAYLALIGSAVALVAALAHMFPDRITTPEQWTGVAGGVGMIAIVGARLLSGNLGSGKTPGHLAIWAGVIAVLVLGYSFRDEIKLAAVRVRSEVMPDAPQTSAPGEMVIARSDDGSFYVTGQANGQPVRFLVDTGASDIVLSPRDAARLGVNVAALGFAKPVETANGVGYGAPYTLDTLTVGEVTLKAVPVSINKASMSSSLLGMSFFNRMKSFRVEGSRLYIKP